MPINYKKTDKNTTYTKKINLLAVVIASICFFVLGSIGGIFTSNNGGQTCDTSLKFVNEEAVCGNSPVISKAGYAKIQGDISDFIKSEKDSGRTSQVAVYFRDLENGPIFGFDETTDFVAASLLKLPIAIVYAIVAEKNPKVLEQELSFSSQEEASEQHFPPKEVIEVGKFYTVKDLLKRMIVFSDNNAYNLLETHLISNNDSYLVGEVFLEMGLISDGNSYTEDLTVRRYASIFRSLYNASYFNVELSNMILDWLAQSDFEDGLRKNLPSNIEVAHKFGERLFPDGTKQLHDCGIIYYPGNPYLLCIMTKGDDYAELSKIISKISKDVYDEVDSRRI